MYCCNELRSETQDLSPSSSSMFDSIQADVETDSYGLAVNQSSLLLIKNISNVIRATWRTLQFMRCL